MATETTFNTVNVGGLAQLPAWDIDVSGMDQELLPDETARVDVGDNDVILGTKSISTVGFKCYFSGLLAAAADTIAAVQTPLGKLFKQCVGTETLDTGTSIKAATPGTAGLPQLTVPGSLHDDCVMGVATTAYGTVWRPIESISGFVATLMYELPETPVSGRICYAAANYFLVNDNSAQSLHCRLVTERSDQQYDATGCFVESFSMAELRPTKLGTLSWKLKVASWVDTPTPTLAAPVIPGKSPWMDSWVEVIPFGTFPIVYNVLWRRRLRSVSFDVNRQPMGDPSSDASDGVAGWEPGGGPFFRLKMKVNATDDWRDDLAIGQNYLIIVTFGRTPGRMGGFYVRKANLQGFPKNSSDSKRDTVDLVFGVKAGFASAGALFPAVCFFQG